MTKNAKLKQTIRERVAKTGERYAAARRQVLMARDNEKLAALPAAGVVTDAKCREATGHPMAHWFRLLDDWGGKDKGHAACAKYLATFGVSGWYCQAITVSYERARGLREVGQTCAGVYEKSVSRVLPVSMDAAIAAIVRKAARRRWVDGAVGHALDAALEKSKLRKSANGRQARVRLACGGAKIELSIHAKDDGRSTAVAMVQHDGDRSQCEAQRAAWALALDALRAYLKA